VKSEITKLEKQATCNLKGCFYLGYLLLIWRDDANLLSADEYVTVLKKIGHIGYHHRGLVGVEPAGTGPLPTVSPLHSVEDEREGLVQQVAIVHEVVSDLLLG
jgi:hypothetical protein